MTEDILNSDLAKEILTILPYLDTSFVNNIPSNLLAKITDLAADSTKEIYIQKGKKLNAQNLSEECKNWLALLYFEFASITEKNEIINNWLKNE